MQEVAERDRYFNDRVFVTQKDTKLKKEEFDFIFQIFIESDSMKSLVSNPAKSDLIINFLDSNLGYDIYTFKYLNNPTYILKVCSGDGFILEKEFEILKKIEYKNIAPKAIFHETLTNYGNLKILVSSFESGFNFKELHNIDLVNSLPLISENFKKIHEEIGDSNEYQNLFDFYFDLLNFEENLNEEIYQKLKKDYLFVKCKYISDQLLEMVKMEIDILDNSILDKSCLCHTNIQAGSMLFNSVNLKFVNFYSSFNINPLFDLAFCSIYLGLNSDLEKKFLDSYLLNNANISEEYLNTHFDSVKSICYKFILCKIIALSYYEKLIHRYDRMDKHIQIYDLYMNLRDYLGGISPFYKKYFDKAVIFFS